ncbi:MAG: hypothetical protein HW380_1087 [Magnetococcales bacterium]|nr:hypothetical protein [Magnetococcales bacterium]
MNKVEQKFSWGLRGGSSPLAGFGAVPQGSFFDNLDKKLHRLWGFGGESTQGFGFDFVPAGRHVLFGGKLLNLSKEMRQRIRRGLLQALPTVMGIAVLALLLSGVVYFFRLWKTLTHI